MSSAMSTCVVPLKSSTEAYAETCSSKNMVKLSKTTAEPDPKCIAAVCHKGPENKTQTNEHSDGSCRAPAKGAAVAGGYGPDVPLASAGSDMIRWSRILLSHTLDAARSY